MPDAKQVSVKELYQQSVLEAAGAFQDDLKLQLQSCEGEIAEMESKKEWMHQQIHEYRRLQEEMEQELKSVDDVLNKKCIHKSDLQKKRLMIQDLKAFARGECFGKGHQGAQFFVSDLKGFCDATGEGMVTVRERVGQKAWYGMLELKGKCFVYLRNREGEVFVSGEVGGSFLAS